MGSTKTSVSFLIFVKETSIPSRCSADNLQCLGDVSTSISTTLQASYTAMPLKNSQLRLIQQINTGGKVGTSHVIGKIVVHCHEVCHNFPTNIFSE